MRKNKFWPYILLLFIGIAGIFQLSGCNKDINSNFKKDLSIIVPVYNVEEYLEKCLDSLINQTFKDIEIICINDGSTDNSLNILKKYQQKDNRIIIVDQENKGVSAARNKGILTAQGDYITFVDPDDFVDLNVYKECMNTIKENDADIGTFDFLFEPYGVPDKKLESKIYKDDPFGAIDDPNISVTVWNKIYRRSMLIDNNLLFKEDVHYGEDDLFKLMSFPKAKTIVLIPDVFYHYKIQRIGSAENILSIEKRLISAINIAKYLTEDYMLNQYSDRKIFLLKYSLGITYNRIIELDNQNKQKLYSSQILEILDSKLLNQIDNISSEHKNMISKLRYYASL